MRLLFGLERVPASMAEDDPRLPSVELAQTPLRLNSLPLPQAAWGADVASHQGKVAATTAWLQAQCGDYNAGLRRAVARVLDAYAAQIDLHRAEIAADLARFDGLYRPEDLLWSALRPLPRAWWRQGGQWQRADLAFWDGRHMHAVLPRAVDGDAWGVVAPFAGRFWQANGLPMSPFRLPL